MIYLDNNATTRPLDCVIDAVDSALRQSWFNPSSRYPQATSLRKSLDAARADIAAFLCTTADRLVFTSGGTESSNSVFHTILREAIAGGTSPAPRPVFLALATDHSASLRALEKLAQAQLAELRVCPVRPDGIPDLSAWSELARGASLATFALANNETGVLAPAAELIRAARAAGARVHADMVQVAGKLPVELDALAAAGLDYASFSAHKLHGPKGVGALWFSPGAPLHCLVCGGSQENFLRAGTENVPGILGFAAAARDASAFFSQSPQGVSPRLRDLFEATLGARLPEISFPGQTAPRLPQTSSVTFHDCPAEGLMLLLDRAGICCSAGSACQSGSPRPSHVLSAMGLSESRARSTLRFSFSRFSTDEEVVRACDLIVAAVERLRSVQSSRVGNVVIYSPKKST